MSVKKKITIINVESSPRKEREREKEAKHMIMMMAKMK